MLVGGIVVTLARERSRGMPVLRTTRSHLLLLAIAVYATLSALFAGTLRQNDAFFGLLGRPGPDPVRALLDRARRVLHGA